MTIKRGSGGGRGSIFPWVFTGANRAGAAQGVVDCFCWGGRRAALFIDAHELHVVGKSRSSSNSIERVLPSVKGLSSSSAHESDDSSHAAMRIPGPVAKLRCVVALDLADLLFLTLRFLPEWARVIRQMSNVGLRVNSAPRRHSNYGRMPVFS